MTTEMNLSIGIEKYIEHLAALGKKPSTIGTAKRTMALLQQHLGDSKVISKILTVHVANFYSSDAATTQPCKGGTKPRALPSILQIRRIVRDALVYWHAKGYLANVPLPKDEKKFLKTEKAPKQPKGKTPQIDPPLPPEAYIKPTDEAKAGIQAQADALSTALNTALLTGDNPDAADAE